MFIYCLREILLMLLDWRRRVIFFFCFCGLFQIIGCLRGVYWNKEYYSGNDFYNLFRNDLIGLLVIVFLVCMVGVFFLGINYTELMFVLGIFIFRFCGVIVFFCGGLVVGYWSSLGGVLLVSCLGWVFLIVACLCFFVCGLLSVFCFLSGFFIFVCLLRIGFCCLGGFDLVYGVFFFSVFCFFLFLWCFVVFVLLLVVGLVIFLQF